MENINFRGIPTSLFLNGPKLGIVTDPQSLSDVVGVATFTGIATATFPDTNFALDGGSVAFKWYYDGSQILDTTEDSDSNASIVGFSSATGAGSTITINGITTDDTGKEIYFEADYVPSAYQTTPPRTAGTARSTGNAFNEPIQSGIATVTVKPIIEITTQPEDVVIGQTFAAEYSVAARTTPGNGAVNYQWQLDGNDLSDGTTTTTVQDGASGKIKLWRLNDPSHAREGYSATNPEEIDVSQNRVFGLTGNKFSRHYQGVTVVNFIETTEDMTFKITANGADGGTSQRRSVAGGKGGQSIGTYTFKAGQKYKMIVGQANWSSNQLDGASPGGTSQGESGYGGGFTGLFIADSFAASGEVTFKQSEAILIAGGGGGGADDPATGGAGGGLTGGDGGNSRPGRGGAGGTQSAGGAGGSSLPISGGDGSALQGGSGGGGGGGGGYFGGGSGGGNNGCCADGAGGGGSAFFYDTADTTSGRGENVVSDITTTVGGSDVQPSPINDGALGGIHGSFFMELVSTTKTVTTTITGATTPNLSITTNDEASGVIRCKVTADGVQKSPVFSGSVSYYVVGIRNVLNIEQYNYTDATATLSEHDLSNGSLSISYDTHPGNAICLYAGEKDVEVEMDMYGGKGIGFDEPGGTGESWSQYNGEEGGEGGYSKIRFTMKKDEEYVLTGLFSGVNAPFLYRKGTLIAAVGEGGWGGHYGRGGAGGGVKTDGEDGQGRHAGVGGRRYLPGNLPSDSGTFGTRTSLDGDTPDGKASGNAGGKTIPCARGVYWRNQGKAPCEDLGTIKFRTPDGTEISNTASISRGYKSGYNIIQTGGTRGGSDGGNGGNGVTGGEAGTSGGGGGGSGYHDGSITEVFTGHGGSTGPARINIKLSVGDYFIDDEGRILIYSSTDARDPRTEITKTTGVVNYGDNACIDDARWQRFLDLARDGTQDYRLTATENNSTTKITNATEKNIYKMMNANQVPLRTSLTDWYDTSYSYLLLVLAWDETDGSSITGGDYSLWSYSPASSYGYGFYGDSSNKFFAPTVYGYKTGINFWILPPGVPDFS